jgi:DNA-binding response OmpR family regulator
MPFVTAGHVPALEHEVARFMRPDACTNPLMPEAPRGASPARPSPRVARGARHVLVVEDDSPIRALVSDLLHEEGYNVVQASDGFEALNQLRSMRPDLIVLDLMLPGMTGWQFLERSQEQLEQGNIPVLILSAVSGQDNDSSSLGVAAWLNKPIDVDRFLGAVKGLAGPAEPVHRGRPGLEPHAASSVLVVEDDYMIGELLVEHLAGEGFESCVTSSIEGAMAQIERERPALIVLDLMLPGRSGWDFLRERGSVPALSEIPVLVISAAPEARLLEAMALGADAFLSKPFDLDVLSAMVGSLAR